MFLCGIGWEEGYQDDFWPIYCTLPGVMFAVVAPLLLMRHFANWRIVDPNRIYPKQPADLGSLFVSIAALALIFAALRVPQTVFRVPAPSFWMTSLSIGIVTMLVSSVVTLPLAAFVLNNERAKSRIVATIVFATVAYVVFLLCMFVIGLASGQTMPTELLVAAGATTVTATFVVFVGVQAIRGDGFRLRTNTNGLATWTLPQTDEEKQHAELSLNQNRKRTVLQLLGCFVIMAALNAYVSVNHSAEAQYARGIVVAVSYTHLTLPTTPYV